MMKSLAFIFVFILLCSLLSALEYHSQTSGNWDTPLTWGSLDGVPGPGDDVYIHPGHNIYADGYYEIYIHSLEIMSNGYASGALFGGYNADFTLHVEEDVSIDSAAGNPAIAPGPWGEFHLYLGGSFFISGDGTYDVLDTVFTALPSYIPSDFPQLGCYGNPGLQTVFSTLYPDTTLELMQDITFPASLEYGFLGCRLNLWPDLGFVNTVFNHCQLMPRASVYVNTLANCHLYSCTLTETVYFDGAVAVMDNGNVFNNLSIRDGGSLWGNYNTLSSVDINGNLVTALNSSVSPGAWGSLNINLAGNLQIGGSFIGNNVYFDGMRDALNPQLIGKTADASLSGSFTNVNSVLKLSSDLAFVNAISGFYAGSLYLDGHTLSQVSLYDTTIQDIGALAVCMLSWVFCQDDIVWENCTMVNSSSLCLSSLTVNQNLSTVESMEITLRVVGNLLINPGATIQPGAWGTLAVTVDGDIYNYGNVNWATLNFNNITQQQLSWNAGSVFNGTLNCYTPKLLLNPAGGTALDLNNNSFTGIGEVTVALQQGTQIRNGVLNSLDFIEDETYHSYTLDLGNVSFQGCDFATPVLIGQPCTLNHGNSFLDQLTLQADLISLEYNSVVVDVLHLSVENGNLSAGAYGFLTVSLSGNLNCYPGRDRTSQLNLNELNLVGSSTQYLMSQIAMNCNVIVYNCPLVVLQSDLNFPDGAGRYFHASGAPGAVVDLANHTISSARISNSRFVGGTFTNCSLDNHTSENIVFTGTNWLTGNIIRLEGYALNWGILTGLQYAAATLHCYGSFENRGTVTMGPDGSLDVFLYGNVTETAGYTANWFGNLHLVGNQQRYIHITYANSVAVDYDSSFSLSGVNYMPSFNIAAGSMLTVPEGASLRLAHPNEWYGGNLVMNGSFANRRILELAPQVFHALSADPQTSTPAGSMMDVTHVIGQPGSLTGSTGEYWISSLIDASSLSANLSLSYRGSYDPNQRLYYSVDSGSIWTPVFLPGQNDGLTNTLTVVGFQLPAYCWLAISTVYDAWNYDPAWAPAQNTVTGLLPSFSWPALTGAMAYRLDISCDGWQSMCYTSGAIAETSHSAAYALAPGTVYQWQVSVTSSSLGDLSSDGNRAFQTRPAIVSVLPASAAYLPGDLISYYLPAFIQNLLPGESLTVTPYSSAHLNASYQDGVLTITPQDGWTGVETIDMQIGDGFTLLNPSIQITILGQPGLLTLAVSEQDGNYYSDLSWTAVPGATHYRIYSSASPEGPWVICAWATDPYISLAQSEPRMFYQVRANTGAPE